jgi:hypothetical protein
MVWREVLKSIRITEYRAFFTLPFLGPLCTTHTFQKVAETLFFWLPIKQQSRNAHKTSFTLVFWMNTTLLGLGLC